MFRAARAGKAPSPSRRRRAQTANSAPLLSPEEARDYQLLWALVEGGFVSEPRRAVEQADGLAMAMMRRLAEILAEERANLEGQWIRDKRVSSENLRLALRHYQFFFTHLLSP